MMYPRQIRLAAVIILLFWMNFGLFAQKRTTVVQGSVKDFVSEEILPFVNVYFKGSSVGTTTDIDGNYYIKTNKPYDTLVISFIGYETIYRPLKVYQNQTLNLELKESAAILKAVEIKYNKKDKYKNPAWDVMRGFIGHRHENDRLYMRAHEYENYNQIQLYVTEMAKGLQKARVVRKLLETVNKFDTIKSSSGKQLIPLFYSESIGKSYYLGKPRRFYEHIQKNKFKGIALREGGGVNTLIGSSRERLNFYKNTIPLFTKEFVCPLTTNWRVYYDYILESDQDTLEDVVCYRLRYSPKQSQNLTFQGKVWISKKDFALKKITAQTHQNININFVEKIYVEANYVPVKENLGANKVYWMPESSVTELWLGEILENISKVQLKFTSVYNNYILNKPHPLPFYLSSVTVADDVSEPDENLWRQKQQNMDSSVFAQGDYIREIIDSIGEVKPVKRLEKLLVLFSTGYHTIGKIDLGPYPYLYAFNDIEGHRFQLGFKTNGALTNKMTLSGSLAYGTLDKRFKYEADFRYIPLLKPWLVFNASYSRDLTQISLYDDRFNTGVLFNSFDNTGTGSSAFVRASLRSGTLIRPYDHKVANLWVQSQFSKNFFQTVALRNRQLTPIFPFEYKINNREQTNQININELILESRLSFNEQWVFNRNQNTYSTLGTFKPVFVFRYTQALDFGNSNISYQKVEINMIHSTLTNLGNLTYRIQAGRFLQPVPYLLIESHPGNPTPFFSRNTFNLLEVFEYSSDQYVALFFNNNFNGLLFNYIPLLRRLKWRSEVGLRLVYGTISQGTKDLVLKQTSDGRSIPPVTALDEEPYVEMNFGIHNILKILRVDFVTRLTYRKNPNRNYAVKFAMRISL